jgi:hypothetical protein
MNHTTSPSRPLIFFCLLVLLYHVGSGLYLARGAGPTDTLDLLYQGGLLWAAIWWLKVECRKRRVELAYCPGLLVSVAWMIVIPYYLFKLRGARGFLRLLALIGLFVGAKILAAVVYVIFSR